MPKFNMTFQDSTDNFFFFKHQNKVMFVIELLNSRTWLSHKNSVAIFLPSDIYAASLTSAASETSMASTTLKIIFHQKNFLILTISFPLVPE
jgi:hypothetical protein